MTTLEIFNVAIIISTLILLRFGVPILLTWALGQMLQRLHHS
jgi:hypothetical protein